MKALTALALTALLLTGCVQQTTYISNCPPVAESVEVKLGTPAVTK